MKEIASNIKCSTYFDKYEVISFIEKCLLDNNQPFDKTTIDRDLDNFNNIYLKDNLLIFRINDKIIGTAGYIIETRYNVENIKIVRIYLDKNHKGKGYGKILFMSLLALIRIRHRNINIAYLTTHTKTMEVAYNMYKFFGFKDCNDFAINKKRCNVLMKLKL